MLKNAMTRSRTSNGTSSKNRSVRSSIKGRTIRKRYDGKYKGPTIDDASFYLFILPRSGYIYIFIIISIGNTNDLHTDVDDSNRLVVSIKTKKILL